MELSQVMETSADFVRGVLPSIPADSHKGSRGRLLLVCGSYGMAGACIMAARAALRSGVGLLHIAAEERIYPILAQAVPEAVFTIFNPQAPTECEAYLCGALSQASACVIGCGLGTLADTLLSIILNHSTVPTLLDADALNAAARKPELLTEHRCPLILTPHPGEMARLSGLSISAVQASRLALAREFAKETDSVVLLKGVGTLIADPDGRILRNPTGNAGLARGGSGDVLSGIIGSLLAQGAAPFEAAAAGAWLHGTAADSLANTIGIRAMLPTDLMEELPGVLRSFEIVDISVDSCGISS